MFLELIIGLAFLCVVEAFHVGALTTLKSGYLCRSQRYLTKSIDSENVNIISSHHLEELATKGYTVVPNFLSSHNTLQSSDVRQDVKLLRHEGKFRVSPVGQHNNTIDAQVRAAESCSIKSRGIMNLNNNTVRSHLCTLLCNLREELDSSSILKSDNALTKDMPTLAGNLDELLYAYYPKGGFYRRHLDTISSVLRCYSILLYCNDNNWRMTDGGQLRLYG